MTACRSAIKFQSFVFLTHPQYKSNPIITSKTKLKILCYPSLCLKVSSGRISRRIHAYANYSDTVQNEAYRTVKVKLILHKECQFGEEFYAVGEAESLGSWDPQSAVLMKWNPGHIWTTPPVDLPVGKEICFKFVLRDQEGEIQWQPGPDRVFCSSETRGTLLVSVGWDDIDVQTSTEEEEGVSECSSIGNDHVLVHGLTIADSGGGSECSIIGNDSVLVPGLTAADSGGASESSSIGGDPVLVPGLTTADSGGGSEYSSIGSDYVLVHGLTTADSGGARKCSSIGNDHVLVHGLTAADSGGASEFSSIGNDPVLVPGLTTVMDYGRDCRTEESQNGAYEVREEEQVSGGENSYAVSDNHASVREESLTTSNAAQTPVVEASTSIAMKYQIWRRHLLVMGRKLQHQLSWRYLLVMGRKLQHQLSWRHLLVMGRKLQHQLSWRVLKIKTLQTHLNQAVMRENTPIQKSIQLVLRFFKKTLIGVAMLYLNLSGAWD